MPAPILQKSCKTPLAPIDHRLGDPLSIERVRRFVSIAENQQVFIFLHSIRSFGDTAPATEKLAIKKTVDGLATQFIIVVLGVDLDLGNLRLGTV